MTLLDPATDFFTRMSSLLRPLFLCACLQFFVASHAAANPIRNNHVEAELIAAVDSVQPGMSFDLVLRLKMDPHWHTYWKNPGGQIGLPTRIEWTLPAGIEIGPILWPYPQKFVDTLFPDEPPLISYGYDGEIFLFNTATVAYTVAPETTVTISGAVKWLACETMCVPGGGDLSLSIPIASTPPQPNLQWAERLVAARTRLPAKFDSADLTATVQDRTLHVPIPAAIPSSVGEFTTLTFFPHEPGLIQDWAPQEQMRAGETTVLVLPLNPELPVVPERFSGIVMAQPATADDSAAAAAFEVTVSTTKAASAAPPAAVATDVSVAGDSSITWLVGCLLAFLGGLILNLMPCVLPVLSLKVLNLIKKADGQQSELWKHGLLFCGGVLISVWLLAGVLVAIRAGGTSLGWGFQLQSPVFLVAIISLLFIFSLSLFGVVDIGGSLMGVGAKAAAQSGYAGTFCTGVLAVIVASPCTAPFMGTAMGFALTQPTMVAMTIFTFLGLGLASPYVILALCPGLLRLVPKPGPWMESFKQAMGFPLMATVVWLLWVLGGVRGNNAVAGVLLALLSMAIATWVVGRWATPGTSPERRRVAFCIAGVFLALGAACGVWSVRTERPLGSKDTKAASAAIWEPYSAARLQELRGAGQPVLIDFTADWCLTCKVNEAVGFTDDVVARYQQAGVTLMMADFTGYDEAIGKALAQYGRSGVPLYVLYGRGAEREPVLLPQLLTPKLLLEALEQL